MEKDDNVLAGESVDPRVETGPHAQRLNEPPAAGRKKGKAAQSCQTL